jgi:tubulin polyglutamylase TTLL9
MSVHLRLTGQEEQIGGYDLIYKGDFLKPNPASVFTTSLGTHNNRDKQLRRMWKQIRKRKQEQQTSTSAAGGGAASQPDSQSQGQAASDKTQAQGGGGSGDKLASSPTRNN